MTELNEREVTLLMKALDGALTDAERVEFEQLLSASSTLRDEWQSLKRVKEVTMTMKFKRPAEETWDHYWAGVYARIERGLAWLLISIGAAIFLAVGIYQMVLSLLEDVATPLYLKIGVGAVALGFAILVVSVLREKWNTWKTDKYKEVKR
ncbi:MAG: hypothetical protein FJ217_06325 [Ignavibacteria bacterium]|nr:hypothetical protein [Ignavibacteria bacterium]